MDSKEQECESSGNVRSMSGADESSPDTSPTLFDTAMYKSAEESMHWPTPTVGDINARQNDLWKRYRGIDLATAAYRASISSAAASPASPSATPASARAMQTNAGSGLSLGASFAKLDPDGSWLRTYQGYSQLTLDGSLEAFSQTWPRSGSMRNGTVSELPTSAPRTYGSASSSSHIPTPTRAAEAPNLGSNKTSWPRSLIEYANEPMYPTPQAHDAGKGDPARVGRYGTKHGGRNLNDEVLLPTPQANGWKGPNYSGSGSQSSMGLATQAGGQLNPTWVEWLMGFPLEWTDLEDSEMPLSPKSQSTSGD